MIELYISNGIDKEDAEEIISRMSKYPDLFVNHMMVEELGILPPSLETSPIIEGNSYLFICVLIY